MPQTYEFIKGTGSDEELERYKVCFEKNGTERYIDQLQWIHQQNVAAVNSIYYAIEKESGNIAGIYTVQPTIVHFKGASYPALQSIDTLTDEKHRGKGLFIKLASALYKNAEENDFLLVYGFPNDSSAPGFFKKLGWTSFGEVPFLMKPMRPGYFIKKLLKVKSHALNHLIAKQIDPISTIGSPIQRLSKFDEKYDLLWQKLQPEIPIGVCRDAKYMNWRFITKPGENYHCFGYYEQNTLTGIIVFTLKNKHDGKIGYITELLFDPEKPAVGIKLLRFAAKFFRKNKSDVVLVWCLEHSFNYKCYRRGGYFKLPEKLRPLKLFFGVKSFKPGKEEILDVKNWYISYVDSDTV